MRERLLAERQEHLSEAAEWTERYSTHMADSASDEPARELALSCFSAQADELHEIKRPLYELRTGLTASASRPAPAFLPRVLRAVPWTQYVSAAKRQLEKNAPG